MNTTTPWQERRASAQAGLPPSPHKGRKRLGAWAAALGLSALMAAPMAHAGFTNGGFENGDLTGWTTKRYKRGTGTQSSARLDESTFPPTEFSQLKLNVVSGSTVTGNADHTSNAVFLRNGPLETLKDDTGCSSENCSGGTSTAPNLKLPRWGQNAVRVGGYGSYNASSIEQTAAMTVADIDPIDGKIHVRFALAPILNDPDHPSIRQPYFFVEVVNETKGTQLFNTFNFSNQNGIPWQKNGNYGYTDWQGFDVAPGNGLLDVGDEVTLRVYVANCADSGADHTAVVYLDAVGAFMPGLAVQATGPSSTQPGNDITYTYNYTNNSGVYALGSEVQITAPFTEDGKPLTFVEADIPANCSKPAVDHVPASRGKYITCDVGDLANNQGGSLDVKFKVPSDASTTAPNNVINNGDYNIYANSVSPYLGPLVKTNMPPLGVGGSLVDLGVTIDNGGKTSYAQNEEPTYTVTVTNHSGTETSGTVTQVLTGMGNDCSELTFNPTLGTPAEYACAAEGTDGVKITFPTGDLAANASTQYTVKGLVSGTVVNTNAKVEVADPNVDSNLSNNTAGLNTPVGTQVDLTVNASGNGSGNVLSTEPALKCGTSSVACDNTGKTEKVTGDQEVRFTPVPHPGSMFTGWTGCTAPGAELQGNICVVKNLTGDKTVTANFVQAVLVTPKIEGTGGSIDKGPTQVEKGTTTPPAFIITPEPGKYPKVIGNTDTCKGTMTGPVDGDYTYTPLPPVDHDCEFTVQFLTPQPHVSVVVTPPTGLNVPGEKVYGKVTCTSDGQIAAPNATCEVPQPPGVTQWGTVVCTPADTVDPLAVGDEIVCEYGYTVPDVDPGQPGNPVEITGKSGCAAGAACGEEDEKSVTPNQPAVPGKPGEPHVSIVVTPPNQPLIPGTTVTGKFVCTSDGAVTANGATCELAPGEIPPGWSTSCTPTPPQNLAVGQIIDCEYTYTVPTEPVRVDGKSGCAAGASCGHEDGKVLVPNQPSDPHITTVVTPPAQPPVPGTTVTGKVTCTSDGGAPALQAMCVVPQPPGVTEWENLGCTPAVPVASLNHDPQQSIVCEYRYKVPEEPFTITGTGSCDSANCGSDDGVRIVPREAAPVQPIPTLSQWGLIVLSLMMGLMMLASRRRYMR